MSKAAASKSANTFAGLGDMLGSGFSDGLMSEGAPRQMFKLQDIEVEQQVREEFEDGEQSIADLARSMAEKGQIAPILLRKNRTGRVKPYLLVVGGRRTLAAKFNVWDEIWGELDPEMTDEQAESIQLAENIHRKNLTQFEEAKRIQRDLDQLGNVEAVLAKHNKSRAWLSKILSLLSLPEQAKRLVKENISADLEVINTVKTIARADPKKAEALVDDLKKTRGKANAREKVAAVKEEVKPSKKNKEEKTPKWLAEQRKRDAERAAQGGSVATAKDRSQEEPGRGEIFAGAKTARASNRPAHEDVLSQAYTAVFESNRQPKAVLEGLGKDEREAAETFLHTFYEAGKQATDAARVVIEGFRNGGFASDGVGAFALVAYLQGADGKAKFNVLNIFGCMKP